MSATVLAAALLVHASTATAQPPVVQPASAAGCWRSERPLGPTGGAIPVDRDSLYRTVVLRDSGRVALPVVPARERRMWEERSWWRMRRDTVTLRVFTGLQGWSVTLVRTVDGQSLRGTARYLTDVVVAGSTPLEVPVVLSRVACEASWPTVATTTPSLRPWQRGEALYYAHQVEVPTALAPGTTLPSPMVALRSLRSDERGGLDTTDARSGITRVLLQFVVESDGRVDASSVKVLASDGHAYATQATTLVVGLRYTPAMLKGVAVHQLAQTRIELRR